MEYSDVYNKRHELLGYKKQIKELVDGEYKLSCFIWIMNDKDELLIQKRLATAKLYPNMWETAAGSVIAGETALEGALRELREELGVCPNKKDVMFIGSHVRTNDYVEVFLLKSNIDINELILQKEEVQDVKWVSIDEYEELIKSGDACDNSYIIFKNYYDNYYDRHVVLEEGNLVYKKINPSNWT